MDWLILILGVPAILIPLVLLFGFAGCDQAPSCTEDRGCPDGTRCVENSCVPVGESTLSPPELTAISHDDHSVSLTWTSDNPAGTVFEIERAQDGFHFGAITPADLSATGATDDASASPGLQMEGVTFLYHVRATLPGQEPSAFSEPPSAATVLPKAPVELRATAVSFDEIDLTWQNASASTNDFILEHREPGGRFREIPHDPGTTAHHRGLVEGTLHEYRVFAVVVEGVENDERQDVRSAASAIASATTLGFTAFTAPPGTLTTNQAGVEGFCVVQRLSQTLLTASGTQVRILLRGSTVGSLTLDKVTISQVATAQPGTTVNPYDPAADLTVVASNVTIPANTAVTVGPVNYALDRNQDLLVAFDISNTPGQDNVRHGTFTGADTFSNPATAEADTRNPATADVQRRTPNYAFPGRDNLALVEKIVVF